MPMTLTAQENKLYTLALSFYTRGRVDDVQHVNWLLSKAEAYSSVRGIRMEILIPLIILHDVGYSAVENPNSSPKDVQTKVAHMQAGSAISKTLLDLVGYRRQQTEEICHLVSVHDNWILGDDTPYRDSIELAVLNDLDFLWAQSSLEQYVKQARAMKKKLSEMCSFWLTDEKLTRRPFCCEASELIFRELIERRLKDSR